MPNRQKARKAVVFGLNGVLETVKRNCDVINNRFSYVSKHITTVYTSGLLDHQTTEVILLKSYSCCVEGTWFGGYFADLVNTRLEVVCSLTFDFQIHHAF